MPWYFFATISAFSISSTNLLTKKVSGKVDFYTMAWVRNALSLPVLWVFLLLSPVTQVNSQFWTSISVMLPFEVIVALLYFKAISISPLSLTIPFTSFTPVFVAIGAFFVLGEKLTSPLIFACILLVLGAYILNINKATGKNFLRPFLALASEKGSLFMFLVTMLWGIYTPFAKIGIENSSPQFFSAVYMSLFVILFTPILIFKGKNKVKSIKENLRPLLLVGVFNGIFLIAASMALNLGTVTIVNAFGTIAIPTTVILAGSFLKEKNLYERLLATFVMMLGAIIAVIYG